MRLVIALGGNALLRRGEAPEVATQRAHVRAAVAALAPLVHHHEVIVTHGNGPQVGLPAGGTADEQPLSVLTAADMARLDLAEGSMGPKVLAAARFAERTGGFAAIGALEEAVAIVAGERGTRVVPGTVLA